MIEAIVSSVAFLFWNLLGIGIIGYLAYKFIPAASEYSETMRDRCAFERAKVQWKASSLGFSDLSDFRAKERQAPKPKTKLQKEIEEIKQIKEEMKELKSLSSQKASGKEAKK